MNLYTQDGVEPPFIIFDEPVDLGSIDPAFIKRLEETSGIYFSTPTRTNDERHDRDQQCIDAAKT